MYKNKEKSERYPVMVDYLHAKPASHRSRHSGISPRLFGGGLSLAAFDTVHPKKKAPVWEDWGLKQNRCAGEANAVQRIYVHQYRFAILAGDG